MQPFYRVKNIIRIITVSLPVSLPFFLYSFPSTPPYHSPPFSPAAASASQLSKPQFSYKISGFH